jgi:hypothetical protein
MLKQGSFFGVASCRCGEEWNDRCNSRLSGRVLLPLLGRLGGDPMRNLASIPQLLCEQRALLRNASLVFPFPPTDLHAAVLGNDTALARVFGTLLRDPRRLPRCLYNLGLRRSHYPHQLAADVEAFDRRHGVAPTWCRLHVHDSNVVLDGTTDAPPSWLSAFAVCAATVTARIASNLTASVT